MTGNFQIKWKYQFKSVKWIMTYGLFLALSGFAPLLIVFFSEPSESAKKQSLLIITGLYCLLMSSPTLYLHFSYLISNWESRLTVDGQKIRISDKKREISYTRDEIAVTELNLGIYHKNKRDNKERWSTFWTNYGYLRVKFKDGKEFYFTSLMLDLNELPFPVATTRFRFIPYIDRNRIKFKHIRARQSKVQQDKIDSYKEAFVGLTNDKLLEKLDNPKIFEFEARKAAQIILEERRAITTANKVHMPLPGTS